jgi:multiple sugar transport system permease protein
MANDIRPESRGTSTNLSIFFKGHLKGQGWFRIFLGWFLLLMFIFPFYWVIVTSLNGSSQVMQYPPTFLPHWQWINYLRAWSEAPWVTYFANTIFIASTTTLLALATSLLAGFSLGVLQFKTRNLWFAAILSLLMIPQTVLLIPDYILMRDIGWLNTYWVQIVPWGASVFGIFLLRQYMLSLPRELIEAAELDGASRMKFLARVAMPMVKPALVVIGLYVFIGSWDSFLWPFIMTQSPSVQPIEVGLASFLGTNGYDWTGLSAAVVFTTLPVMLLFLVAQRQFLEGAHAFGSGLKG